MSGGSLSTKGLVSGLSSGSSSLPVVPPPIATPPSLDNTSPTGSVLIVVPTAVNFCLMVAENITANLRAQMPANLTVLSLYKRAFLIATVSDEVAIVRQ